MDNNIVIIDGNNLFTRGFIIANTQKRPHFRFVLTMLENLKEKYSKTKMVFTFDTTKSKRRLDIFPQYKGKRKSSMSQEEYSLMKEMMNDFISLMKFSGHITLEGHGYEADDYIAVMTKMLIQKYIVTIVSTDADLLQLINDRVKVYDPIKSYTVTSENFQRIIGVSLKHFVDYKCLRGDDSDGIDGIDGVGEKTAQKYIDLYGSYDNIHKSLKEIPEDKRKVVENRIVESTDLMERNRLLMDLSIMYSDENIKAIIKQVVRSSSENLNKEIIMKLLAKYDSTEYIDKLKLYETKQ